jgi:hypothetical protein
MAMSRLHQKSNRKGMRQLKKTEPTRNVQFAMTVGRALEGVTCPAMHLLPHFFPIVHSAVLSGTVQQT